MWEAQTPIFFRKVFDQWQFISTKTRTAEHRKVFGCARVMAHHVGASYVLLAPTFFKRQGALTPLPLLSPVWRARRSNFTILIQTRIIRTRFRSKMDPDDALFIRNTAAGHNAPPPQRQQPQDKIKPINTTNAGTAVLTVPPPFPPSKICHPQPKLTSPLPA